MTTYRDLWIKDGTHPGDPPRGNVLSRRVASRWSMHQALAAQDRIIGSGRRVVACLPLGPVDDTFAPDSNPDLAATNPTYPDSTTEYTVKRLSSLDMTPGSVLVAKVLALPSGPTQYRADVGEWDEDSRKGIVKFEITLTDEDSNTVTIKRQISIPASQLQYGKKPDNDGECWLVAFEDEEYHIPTGYDDDAATAAKWTGPHVKASIAIKHIGSPRVIDLILYERPRRLVRDISEAVWPAHLYSQGGQPYDQLPHTFPVEQASGSDPAIGNEWAIKTARQTAKLLGPMLFAGSSWDQGTATVLGTFSSSSHGGNNTNGTGDNEAPPIGITSTSFVNLHTGGTTFSADQPGYAMGCGAYGRDAKTSHQQLILPNNGVVSVIVGVYCTTGLGSGTVRFWVSPYSYIDIAIGVGGYGWRFAAGHLECGTGPEDDKTCSIWGKVSSGGIDLYVRDWACWRAKDAT